MKFLTIIRLVGEASVLYQKKTRMLKKGSYTHTLVLGQRLSRGSLWVFFGCTVRQEMTYIPKKDLRTQKRQPHKMDMWQKVSFVGMWIFCGCVACEVIVCRWCAEGEFNINWLCVPDTFTSFAFCLTGVEIENNLVLGEGSAPPHCGRAWPRRHLFAEVLAGCDRPLTQRTEGNNNGIYIMIILLVFTTKEFDWNLWKKLGSTPGWKITLWA